MKVAQLAPLFEAVPPVLYGGTERVVYWLTEALVKKGVDVTLFASGDSRTSAHLLPMCEKALRLDGRVKDALAFHCVMVEELFRRQHEFDLVHAHIDYAPFQRFRQMTLASLTTMHARVDSLEMKAIFHEFKEQNMVSISRSQKAYRPEANWVGTVYHGLPADLYKFQAHADDYLLFLGRICPEKRLDLAIEIAGRAGMHLKVAAKVDAADAQYFEKNIKHLLDLPWVEYLGEATDRKKNELLGNARALLFPIDWPEPFGLVMIEAMACGTPVIAFRRGSVPEIIEPGINGFICDDIDSAVEATRKLSLISRESCRERFEQRYTAEHMAENYLAIYNRLSKERNGKQNLLERGLEQVISAARNLISETFRSVR